MITRTLAASILALGFLSPAAFSGDNDFCSTNQAHRGEYPACNGVVVQPAGVTAGAQAFAIPDVRRTGKWRSIGNYIDETAEERNQRSSKH